MGILCKVHLSFLLNETKKQLPGSICGQKREPTPSEKTLNTSMQSYRRHNRKNTTPSLVQMVPEHGQDKSKRVRIVQKTLMQQEFLPTLKKPAF